MKDISKDILTSAEAESFIARHKKIGVAADTVIFCSTYLQVEVVFITLGLRLKQLLNA